METYDSYSGKRFQIHVAVLWTISDFSAYGYLSGWVSQSYNACPVCLDMTDS